MLLLYWSRAFVLSISCHCSIISQSHSVISLPAKSSLSQLFFKAQFATVIMNGL